MADFDEEHSVVASVTGSAVSAKSSSSAVTVESTIDIDDIYPGLACTPSAGAMRVPTACMLITSCTPPIPRADDIADRRESIEEAKRVRASLGPWRSGRKPWTVEETAALIHWYKVIRNRPVFKQGENGRRVLFYG